MGRAELIVLPMLNDANPQEVQQWVTDFSSRNGDWIGDMHEVLADLEDIFLGAWKQISQSTRNNGTPIDRATLRRLRFSLNRLSQMRISNREVKRALIDLLQNAPWLLRNLESLLETLAEQGFDDELLELLHYYVQQSTPLQKYMTAIILRAARHLPTISQEMWQEIILNSTEMNPAVCLFATETWLHIVARYRMHVEDEELTKIRDVTNGIPQPISRLRKNYMLILRAHGLNLADIERLDDPMVRLAWDVANEDRVDMLFDSIEPEEIRKSYYAGTYESDAEGYNLSLG